MKEGGGSSIERHRQLFRHRSRQELPALRIKDKGRVSEGARQGIEQIGGGRTGRHLWTGHILQGKFDEKGREGEGQLVVRGGKKVEVELERNEPRTSS